MGTAASFRVSTYRETRILVGPIGEDTCDVGSLSTEAVSSQPNNEKELHCCN
jgi:hypothetical protein